jgi:hypothetical protein
MTPRSQGVADYGAPYYDVADPAFYHTRSECPVGAAIPDERRRLAVAAMRERLPGW